MVKLQFGQSHDMSEKEIDTLVDECKIPTDDIQWITNAKDPKTYYFE